MVEVEDGDMTRVVLQGRVAKVIKARVAKTSPSPSQQPKMILLLWTEISWDPTYDPYTHNTRSIKAASRAGEDAGQVPNTQATSGSYFYDTIICVFLLCVCLFLFLLLYYK